MSGEFSEAFDMTISPWEPTKFVLPSPSHKGELTPEIVYVEIGRALHTWEHAESALARLFQVLCESRSIAPCRAYGTIESPYQKVQVLRHAAEAFFGRRDILSDQDHTDAKALFTAYSSASEYRNNIAHGMTIGHYLSDGTHSGYFLCPPSYSTKKVKRHKTSELYLSGAKYFYKAEDVLHYSRRFQEVLVEVVRIAHSVNDKYKVIPPSELHP